MMSELKGAVRRGETGYDEARKRVTWNKRLEKARSPDAIVCVRSAEETAAAIRFAAANDLKVSPRGSGHHYEAAALRDGGLLLDLGGLDSIEIDPQARLAKVGSGAVAQGRRLVVMPASARRDLQTMRSGEADGRGHLRCGAAFDYSVGRASLFEPLVPDDALARFVVASRITAVERGDPAGKFGEWRGGHVLR